MSASREKKNRQGQEGTGFSDPRTAREAESLKQERRTNIMYAAIGVLFVVVALIVVVVKSGVLQNTVSAATIHGEKYKAEEVNYYYVNAYNSFLNQYGDYISYIGLDPTQSLKAQQSAFSEGQTWHEYFVDQGLATMSSVHALADKAEAEGFTVDDLDEQIKTNLDDLASFVEEFNTNNNTSYTAETYLQAMYGEKMTLDLYKEQVRLAIIASEFSNDYQNNQLSYTLDDLKAEYEANRQDYDVVNYESIFVSGSVPTKDADGNDVEVTDEMTAAAMAEAKTTAEGVLSSFQSGETLEAQSAANEDLSYNFAEEATYSSAPAAAQEWLFDTSRKAGDVTVLEADTGYYVVLFHTRSRYDYNTVDVRHILIQTEASQLAETDEGYDDDVARLKAQAKSQADSLYQAWKDGAATEDSFAELANEQSADPGSNTNGGLYEQVYKGQMVASFNDWCFDESRQKGDTGIVETDYGYHIMYFVGQDDPYWQVQVENALRTQDYNTWYEEVTSGYEATTSKLGLQYVG